LVATSFCRRVKFGSGQSKQRVDGKDWLITLCNLWSNKAVRVTKTELTKTNKLN